jgi:hypothetical protein
MQMRGPGGWMLLLIFAALVQGAEARPLSEWERYQSESSMTAYLNRLVGTYIDPSIFHLSIHILGNVNSESSVHASRRPSIVRGKELNPGSEQDEIEMLPALPFYQKRIQKTKEMRLEGFVSSDADAGMYQMATPSGEVVSISRITVNLLFDSMVNEKAIDFITSLIQSTIGLDEKRGDGMVVQVLSFPDRNLNSVSNRVMDAHLRSDSAQHIRSLNTMKSVGQSISIIVALALLLAAGLMFLAISRLSKLRQAADVQTTFTGNTAQGAALSLPKFVSERVDSVNSGNIRNEFSASYSQNQWIKGDEDESVGVLERARMGLEEAIVTRPEEVAFVLEVWILESEEAVEKILFLLGNRRNGLVDLLNRWMSRQAADRLSRGLLGESWVLISQGSAELAAKEWLTRLREFGERGRLSVLHYIDVDSKARLIEENTAENAWLIVFSLPEAFRPPVFERIGLNTALGLIRASSEIPEPNALQIKSLEWELLSHLIRKAGMGDSNEALLNLAVDLLQYQPLSEQSLFIERLSLLHYELADALRNRIVLWTDLDLYENEQLADAARVLSRDELLQLLAFDENIGARILEGRPEREREMLLELAGLTADDPQKVRSSGRKFLQQLVKSKVVVQQMPLAQAA